VEGFLSSLVRGFLLRLPYLLVCIAGLAVLALRWSRHPRSSLFAAIGLAVLLVSSLITVFAYDLVSIVVNRQQMPFDRVEWVYTAMSFLFFLLDAVGLGLVVAAVLAERPRSVGVQGKA
jgi:hypothetical protein